MHAKIQTRIQSRSTVTSSRPVHQRCMDIWSCWSLEFQSQCSSPKCCTDMPVYLQCLHGLGCRVRSCLTCIHANPRDAELGMQSAIISDMQSCQLQRCRTMGCRVRSCLTRIHANARDAEPGCRVSSCLTCIHDNARDAEPGMQRERDHV